MCDPTSVFANCPAMLMKLRNYDHSINDCYFRSDLHEQLMQPD